MPSRNVEKIYLAENYYHVYNRGVNKRRIFMDEEDYAVFLNLLKRYLGKGAVDKKGRHYVNLNGKIELLSFCLMPNHFHLLFYLVEPTALTQLMRNVTTTYTMYFNKKHGRVGHLYQERFKASRIDNDAYLTHIARYIHLNPVGYRTWDFSSHPYYMGDKYATWIHPERILELFSSRQEYADFVEDYESNKQLFDEYKQELADF